MLYWIALGDTPFICWITLAADLKTCDLHEKKGSETN